jgi:hypothetical protein
MKTRVQRTKNSSIANCSKVKCLPEGVEVYEPSETVVDVKLSASNVEEEKLAHINLKKFVSDISHCPDCKTNPAFFLSSKRVPVCIKHWNIIADAPVAWTKEGKITLLAGV